MNLFNAQNIFTQVSQAALTSLHRGGMEGQLMDMIKFPIYFEYMNGVVGRVYAIEHDSVFCTNVKKGLVSMFQVQSEPGERNEVCVHLSHKDYIPQSLIKFFP